MSVQLVSGRFGGKGTATVGSWDAMHTFSTRKSGGNFGPGLDKGGRVHAKVEEALVNFYNSQNLNPCITAIKITVDPKNWTVDWEVTIEESPDGNAYVGFNSWGGANGGYPDKKPPSGHAYSNYHKKVTEIKENYPDSIIADVLDFYFPGGFRQIFFQHTKPKYPNKPKSPNAKTGTVGVKIGPKGSPDNLPEFNGVLVKTTSVDAGTPTQTTTSTGSEDISNSKKAESKQPFLTPTLPYLIKSKVSLKKISGPGEIVGVVEVEAIDGRADFSGIQFTDPGNYVIQVIPSNTEQLIGTTFSVTVTGEPVEEQPLKGEDKPITANRPIIAQIDETRIKLPPMEHEASENDTDNINIVTTTGAVPFVYYAGSQINASDIDSLDLYYEDCVPKLKITINDTLGKIKVPESNPVKNPIIELFLNPGSKNLKYIHLQFIIVSNLSKRNGLISFECTLDIKDFYKKSTKSYKSTSFNALREFAKDMNLGFNSNINDTDDLQVWSRKNGTGSDFIKEVFQHAYINDDTFVMAYIDFYYCLNYVDVQKELERDISKDTGLMSNGVAAANDISEDQKVKKMIISNQHKGHGDSFTFQATPKVNNNTQKVNRKFGTQTESKSYDRLGKRFLVFVVDALTGDQSKNVQTRTEDDMKTNTLPSFGGKVDYDSVHKNYAIAYDMQLRNFLMLSNNTAELVFTTPNYNIYRYQKIQTIFENTRTTATDPKEIDIRLTGEWVILDISYVFKKGSLAQKVVIARRELSKTPEEIKKEVTEQPKDGNAEINENPDTENKIVPNSTYSVGQKVLVEQNQKRYIIEVTAVLDNGVDIEGVITEFNTVTEKPTQSMQADTPVGEPKPSEKGDITIEKANSRSKNLYNYSYSEREISMGTFKNITIKDKEGKILMQVDNTSKPMISQSDLIWLAIEKVADELLDTNPTTSTTSTNTPVFGVSIKDPKTEDGKKITGKITFQQEGMGKVAAVGVLSGFPDGSTIGPVVGPVSFPMKKGESDGYDVIADEMRIILQDKIIEKFNNSNTLIITRN